MKQQSSWKYITCAVHIMVMLQCLYHPCLTAEFNTSTADSNTLNADFKTSTSELNINQLTSFLNATLLPASDSQLVALLRKNESAVDTFYQNLFDNSISSASNSNNIDGEVEERQRRQLFIDFAGNNAEEIDSRNGEGRKCTTPSQEDGYCKDLSDCPDLILDLSILRRSVCFKSLFLPGVCCPKSALRTVEETTTVRSFTTPTPRPAIGRPRPGLPTPAAANPAAVVPQAPVHPNAVYRCGVSLAPQQRVVGGTESRRGEWPWMAAIFLHGPKKTEFWCGGSLVSAKFVLTAAHCTKDPSGNTFSPRQFTVRLGDFNIFSTTDDHLVNVATYNVDKITPHPEFKLKGFYNDVALLKLRTEVNFNQHVIPICLPPPAMVAEDLNAMVGQTPTVIGYGSTHYDGDESPKLREAKLPVWRNEDCDDAYYQPITDIFLCAGYQAGGIDACQGDSGGPLLLYVSSRQWVQIGIVSFGNKCAEPGYPGVYTRLTKFMPWIHENMIKQSSS